MIDLTVEWIGATRPLEIKSQIEALYRHSLIKYFGGVENARKSKNTYDPEVCSPFHVWKLANDYAHHESVKSLPPTEGRQSRFKVAFTESLTP